MCGLHHHASDESCIGVCAEALMHVPVGKSLAVVCLLCSAQDSADFPLCVAESIFFIAVFIHLCIEWIALMFTAVAALRVAAEHAAGQCDARYGLRLWQR